MRILIAIVVLLFGACTLDLSSASQPVCLPEETNCGDNGAGGVPGAPLDQSASEAAPVVTLLESYQQSSRNHDKECYVHTRTNPDGSVDIIAVQCCFGSGAQKWCCVIGMAGGWCAPGLITVVEPETY